MAIESLDLGTYESAPTSIEPNGYGSQQLEDIHPRKSEGVLLPTRKVKIAAEIGGALVPATLEIPEEINDSRPLVIVNGYGAKKFGYDNLRAEVAQRRKPAISMHPHGFQSPLRHINPRHLLHPEIPLGKAVWGVMRSVQETADQYPEVDANSFDLGGHSMGLRTSTVVALRKPHAVSSITNIEGVGCENKQDLSRMMQRVLPFIIDEVLPAYHEDALEFEKGVWHALRSEFDYFFPYVPHVLARGYMAATCDNRQDLNYLKKQHGVRLSAIVGRHDRLIPAEETVRASWGLFDYAKVVDSNHLGPVTHPELFAHEIITGINHLNNNGTQQAA